MTTGQPFLLSQRGSNRATAYSMSNKALTLAGKTHVVWTDAIAVTCARTFDHATGQWGETKLLGDGVDNHNTPAITADRDGRLHVAFGPHGSWPDQWDWPAGTFKYLVSREPNTLDCFEPHGQPVGYHATYASLVNAPTGEDCLVYRGGEHPPSLMFQRRTANGGWTNARALFCQRIRPGYTYYGGQVAAAPDGTLYVGAHFYARERSHSLGVAALKSTDMGETWRDLRGQPVTVPLEYSPALAIPHVEARHNPYLSGLALDRQGRLWALTSTNGITSRRILLSRWEGDGWQTVDVAAFLPAERVPCGTCAAGFTIDTRGQIHVVVQAALAAEVANDTFHRIWGHLSNAVFHLVSRDDGRSFTCRQLSPDTPDVFSGLPAISKAGPFHPVEHPVVLFMRGNLLGIPGEGCRATGHNEVYAAFV